MRELSLYGISSSYQGPLCAVQPVEKPADNLAAMPRLAFDDVSCNCMNFPSEGDVIINVAKLVGTRAIAQQLKKLDLENASSKDADVEHDQTVCEVEVEQGTSQQVWKHQ